jgi:hypothetical protein
MSHPITPWKPGANDAGVVGAGLTKKSPPFRLLRGNQISVALKGSQDCDFWIEHGRMSDVPADPLAAHDTYQLPWGTQVVTDGLDATYNVQGGGNSYTITLPAGSEVAQVCLHNAGVLDATGVRVDVGVDG